MPLKLSNYFFDTICAEERACPERSRRGFSLVEIMVVVSVVLVGFVSVLFLLQQTIVLRGWNENYLIAAELAQEGIELTRTARNRNWLSGSNPFDAYINITVSNVVNDSVDNDTYIFSIDERARNAGQGIIQLYSSKDGGNSDLDSYLISGDSRAKLYWQEFSESNVLKKRLRHDDTGAPTKFSRVIKTIYHTAGTTNYADDYLYVISKVYWQDRGKDYFYTLSTYLYDYNWYY